MENQDQTKLLLAESGKGRTIAFRLKKDKPVADPAEKRVNQLERKLKATEKKLREALAESEKFKTVFDQLNQFIGVLDPSGKIIEANRRITRFAGLEGNDIAGKNFWSLGLTGTSPSKVRALREMTLRAAKGEMIRKELEITGCPRQGITVDFSITPVFDDDGNVVMLIPEARDISDRKSMENILRESEAYYHSLFENAHDAILIFDPDTEHVLDVNSPACDLYGFTKEEFLRISLEQITGDVKQGKTKIRELAEKGCLNNYETLHFRKDGAHMRMEINATLFQYKGKNAVLCVMREITQRKEQEDQVLNAAIQAQDMERSRFSSELHDGLGQLLSASRMNFNYLAGARSRFTEKEQNIFDISLNILQRAIQEVRVISWNMMPASLEKFGLRICLEELGEMTGMSSGIEIQTQFSGIEPEQRFDSEIELGVFRIVQELIHNAIRHAQPDLIKLSVEVKRSVIKLTVHDDGLGMQTGKDRIAGSGNGLRNLHSRVKLLCGTMNIQSKQGKGTKVLVEIPLKS